MGSVNRVTKLTIMKKLNKKAALVFNTLISKMNGEQHLKIDNTDGVFMPITIEKLQSDVQIVDMLVDIYSLSHYFQLNGDLVPDPDMTFAVSKVLDNFIVPMTYQDMYNYNEGILIVDGTWKINKRLQHDQADFCSMWLNNIKEQQNI